MPVKDRSKYYPLSKGEAKRLKIGDKLHWNGDSDEASGEVVDIGYAGFQVRWNDEKQTVSTFLYHDPSERFQHLRKV